jgi:putative flippase GtrA
VTCIGIAGGAVVNLVILPLLKKQSPNLAEAAAFVTACAGAFAVREYGKIKGTAE